MLVAGEMRFVNSLACGECEPPPLAQWATRTAVRNRACVAAAGQDKSGNRRDRRSRFISQDMDGAFLSFKGGDNGIVFIIGKHLEPMHDTHWRVYHRIGGNLETLAIQPDVAASSGEKPQFVIVMIVRLNACTYPLVRKMAECAEGRPVWINPLFPVDVIRVSRKDHVVAVSDYHVSVSIWLPRIELAYLRLGEAHLLVDVRLENFL